MRRLATLTLFGIIAALIAASCSQKYAPPTGPLVDTVTVHDTVYVDTGSVDTVMVIDTIFIPNDSCGRQTFCGTIEGPTKTLTWIVAKRPDTYCLTFQAVTEKDQPPQSVSVTIDGSDTTWSVASDPKLVLVHSLSESVITVTSNTPPAYGHGLTICLSIKRK